MNKAEFEIYRDRGGEYRWRVTAYNGNILAVSSEGYKRTEDAGLGAIATVQALQEWATQQAEKAWYMAAISDNERRAAAAEMPKDADPDLAYYPPAV